jgi:hypothetical protein
MINTFTRYRQQCRRKNVKHQSTQDYEKTRNNKRAICSLEYEYKIEKISSVFFVFRLLTCL